jgi:hypothetical protein
MRTIFLYILKGIHDKKLAAYHKGQYMYETGSDKLEELWEMVLKCRNRIRRLEPDFCKGCD